MKKQTNKNWGRIMQNVKMLAKVLSISLILFLASTLIVPFNGRVFAANVCPVYRLSGADRYQTAVAISMEGWTNSNYVVIATGEGDDKFADALAGAPVAYALDAPLLLTTTKVLNTSTRNEIERLNAKHAVILGGTGVVSSNVEKQLKDMGLTIERLYGSDRFETALKIAQKIRSIKPVSKVFLTTGYEFQYAMMAAPFASRMYAPILFSPEGSLSQAYATQLKALGINEVEIIGNTGVVSQEVEKGLKAAGIKVTRVSGTNFSETNVNVAQKYSVGIHTLAVARNDVFADGLAGAAFAARMDIPIILVGRTSIVGTPNGLDPKIVDYIDNFQAEEGYVFGGADVLPDHIINLIRSSTYGIPLYGNSDGNMNNGGIAAIKDGTIFYVNVKEGQKLYSINADGTAKKKLCDDKAWNINVVGNWVYYMNYNDNRTIYKIKTDGTCRTKVNDDTSCNIRVVDNWIYYTNENDNKHIYKIATDGTLRTCLNYHTSERLNIYDGWIYYQNIYDDRRIYKMTTDGFSNTRISTTSAYEFNVQGGWIYLSNLDDDRRLYRMKADGTGLVKLCNDTASSVNVYGSDIYYTNENAQYTMYKIRTDGTSRAPVYNQSATLMNILWDMSGGWIFFSGDLEGLRLYKVRTDGTGISAVD